MTVVEQDDTSGCAEGVPLSVLVLMVLPSKSVAVELDYDAMDVVEIQLRSRQI